MSTFRTEQEAFWAGKFGDEYIGRNSTAREMGARLALFSRIMARTEGVASAIEFGANIGNNLKVLHQMFPAMELAAIDQQSRRDGA